MAGLIRNSRPGGTDVPRKKVGLGGCRVSAAQSSGEWPGASVMAREGRAAGACVEALGLNADVEGGRFEVGGARRPAAKEGGG